MYILSHFWFEDRNLNFRNSTLPYYVFFLIFTT